jgi:hypothetical protein
MKNRLVLLVLGLSGACVGVSADDVAESQAGLGEMSCETAVKDANGTPFDDFGSSYPGSSDWITSPDGNYGSSMCQDQYLVGYGATTAVTRTGWAKWTDPLPTDQSTCQHSFLSVAVYALLDLGGDFFWMEEFANVAGTWSSGSCNFGDPSHPRIVSVGLDDNFAPYHASHLRVAAAAFNNSTSIWTFHPVAVAASYTDP